MEKKGKIKISYSLVIETYFQSENYRLRSCKKMQQLPRSSHMLVRYVNTGIFQNHDRIFM